MTTENPIIKEMPALDDFTTPGFPVWVRLGMLAAGALVAVVPVGGAVFAASAGIGDEPPSFDPDDDIFHLMESLDLGLHLGDLINDGLTETEIETLLELLNSTGDESLAPLDANDLESMSVREIIQAGFAADLHPRDIAAALLGTQEEESFTTVNSPRTVASPTSVTPATVSPATITPESVSAAADQTPPTQVSATSHSTHGHGHGHGSASPDLPSAAKVSSPADPASPAQPPSPASPADGDDPASPASAASPAHPASPPSISS